MTSIHLIATSVSILFAFFEFNSLTISKSALQVTIAFISSAN